MSYSFHKICVTYSYFQIIVKTYSIPSKIFKSVKNWKSTFFTRPILSTCEDGKKRVKKKKKKKRIYAVILGLPTRFEVAFGKKKKRKESDQIKQAPAVSSSQFFSSHHFTANTTSNYHQKKWGAQWISTCRMNLRLYSTTTIGILIKS